jgi:hypothetical protein
MKTTVEISDDLLKRSKRAAREDGKSLRQLIEEGLRSALNARERKPRRRFRLQTFKGDGRTDAFRNASWEQMRDEIYRDRP